MHVRKPFLLKKHFICRGMARQGKCVYRWRFLVPYSSHTFDDNNNLHSPQSCYISLIHSLTPLHTCVYRSHGLTIIIIPMVLKLPCDYLLEYYMCVSVRASRIQFKSVYFFGGGSNPKCVCKLSFLFEFFFLFFFSSGCCMPRHDMLEVEIQNKRFCIGYYFLSLSLYLHFISFPNDILKKTIFQRKKNGEKNACIRTFWIYFWRGTNPGKIFFNRFRRQ